MPPSADSTGNSDETVDNVSARIKQIRKECGFTQKEFAEETGISLSFISDIEGGRSRPGYLFIRQSYLNLQISPLFVVSGQGSIWQEAPGQETDSPLTRNILGIDDSYGKKFIKDTEKMLLHFRLSNTVKMAVLEFFNRYIHANHDLVEKEIKASAKKNRDSS